MAFVHYSTTLLLVDVRRLALEKLLGITARLSTLNDEDYNSLADFVLAQAMRATEHLEESPVETPNFSLGGQVRVVLDLWGECGIDNADPVVHQEAVKFFLADYDSDTVVSITSKLYSTGPPNQAGPRIDRAFNEMTEAQIVSELSPVLQEYVRKI